MPLDHDSWVEALGHEEGGCIGSLREVAHGGPSRRGRDVEAVLVVVDDDIEQGALLRLVPIRCLEHRREDRVERVDGLLACRGREMVEGVDVGKVVGCSVLSQGPWQEELNCAGISARAPDRDVHLVVGGVELIGGQSQFPSRLRRTYVPEPAEIFLGDLYDEDRSGVVRLPALCVGPVFFHRKDQCRWAVVLEGHLAGGGVVSRGQGRSRGRGGLKLGAGAFVKGEGLIVHEANCNQTGESVVVRVWSGGEACAVLVGEEICQL
jgi:hypothetical protein